MSFELFAVMGLVLVLALVLRSYDSALRELRRYRSERELIKNDARKKAVEIVEEARDKALRLLERAEIDASEGRNVVEEGLREAAQKQLDNYKNVLQSMSKDIEGISEREIDEFRKALEMETVAVQKVVGAKLEQRYEQVNRELEEYRVRKLKEINDRLYEITKEAVKIGTGRTISGQMQTELIVEALEEAKRQDVV